MLGFLRFPVFIYCKDDGSYDFYGLPVHGNSGFKLGIDAVGPTVTAQTRSFTPDTVREELCREFLRQTIPAVSCENHYVYAFYLEWLNWWSCLVVSSPRPWALFWLPEPVCMPWLSTVTLWSTLWLVKERNKWSSAVVQAMATSKGAMRGGQIFYAIFSIYEAATVTTFNRPSRGCNTCSLHSTYTDGLHSSARFFHSWLRKVGLHMTSLPLPWIEKLSGILTTCQGFTWVSAVERTVPNSRWRHHAALSEGT